MIENRGKDALASVPLPVSVTLYNLFLPNKKDNKKALLRPEYTTDLLVPVRLDVVFSSKEDERKTAPFEQDYQEVVQDDILMFSSSTNRGALHPKWDHLEEKMDVFYETKNKDFHSLYQSMRVKVIATTTLPNTILADIPLHPSRLRRLPEQNDPSSAASVANSTHNDGGDAWREQRPPPKQLPPNALLVDYSDGSTRVYPPLYHLLVEKHVIREPNPRDASLLQDEQEERKRQSRFTDHVFETLDKVTVVWNHEDPRRPSRKLRPSPSSLLETDDETKAVPIKSLKDGDDDDEEEDYGTSLALSGGTHGTMEDYNDVPERKLAELSLAKQETFLPSELDFAIAELQREKQELEQLIAQEEPCLQKELDELHKNESSLKTLMKKVQQMEEETKRIHEDVIVERRKQKEMEFRLEAQRIKLLKELQTIYPIVSHDAEHQQSFFIRGQEIPSALHGGTVSEDELSAALGYLCHTLVMMSKYLGISLVYRIVCNSSRSAVQQDAITILPLFQARVVEKDNLDRAMTLLHRNVACLLKTRDISYSETSHILSKVKRIYDTIVDGR